MVRVFGAQAHAEMASVDNTTNGIEFGAGRNITGKEIRIPDLDRVKIFLVAVVKLRF